MLTKRWLWIGIGAAILVVAAVCYWPAPKEKPNTQLIDYLQAKNVQLDGQNKVLAQASALLSKQRDSILAHRDSLKSVSDTAEKHVREQAALLPPVVPDSLLQFMYAQVHDLLDRSLANNERLHGIIVDDSLAMRKMFKQEVYDSTRIFNLTAEVTNTQQVANDWHHKYDDLNAERHPRCGKKCGIVLGVLGTIGAAIGIHQVQEATR